LPFTIARSWVRRCSLALRRTRASNRRTSEGITEPANKRMQLTRPGSGEHSVAALQLIRGVRPTEVGSTDGQTNADDQRCRQG
jgi:hypothetical protein